MALRRGDFVCKHCGQLDRDTYEAALEAALAVHQDQQLAYTIADAAAMIGLSERSVERLIAQQELPVVKSGTRSLIRREALEAYLREHETGVVRWRSSEAAGVQLFGRDRKAARP